MRILTGEPRAISHFCSLKRTKPRRQQQELNTLHLRNKFKLCKHLEIKTENEESEFENHNITY